MRINGFTYRKKVELSGKSYKRKSCGSYQAKSPLTLSYVPQPITRARSVEATRQLA